MKKQFNALIGNDRLLLYTWAEALAAQNKTVEANEAATSALNLQSGAVDKVMQHIEVAKQLQQWGLYDWAAQEYRHVIAIADKAGAPSDEGLAAASALSELLHEQGDDLAAAEALRDVVQKVGAAQAANAQVAKRTLGEIPRK